MNGLINILNGADIVSEIEVKPYKPKGTELVILDIMKGKYEIELKEDGIRAIVFKDPDDGQYKAVSSTGGPLNGSWQNIFKELKRALDDDYVFSGEVIDTRYPDERGKALSVAKSRKHPPDVMLYVVWNMFQMTPEMLAKGRITPDAPLAIPYKKMRIELLKMLRKLKPKQVRRSTRYKVTADRKPSDIFKMIVGKGGEGIVAKPASGGGFMVKVKGAGVYMVAKVVGHTISSSATFGGLLKSIDVRHPQMKSKIFTVGGGFSGKQKDEITELIKTRGDLKGLWVHFHGSKPTKPLDKGGVPSNPTFDFLSEDPDGKIKIVESVLRRVLAGADVATEFSSGGPDKDWYKGLKKKDSVQLKWRSARPTTYTIKEIFKKYGPAWTFFAIVTGPRGGRFMLGLTKQRDTWVLTSTTGGKEEHLDFDQVVPERGLF